MPRWGTYIAVAALALIGLSLGLALGQYRTRPVCVSLPDQPVEGPFRPRPKPPPNPAPEPVPATDDDRRLFDRIRTFVDARADAIAVRAEKRAEERAAAQIEQAFDEVGSRLESYTMDQPQLVEGAFGAVFVTKLIAFVGKVLKVLIHAAVLTALGYLLYAYWPWIAGAVVTLIGLLRLWIGSIAAKAVKP